MAHRPNILKLATKISLESLTYTGITYDDPEYKLLEPIVDDDMCTVMMHMRLEANRTAEEIAHRAKKDLAFTQQQLDKLKTAGVIRSRVVNGRLCWYYPIWVPGIMEGVLSNREQCDKYPVLGECFERYTRERVSMLAPFMDVGQTLTLGRDHRDYRAFDKETVQVGLGGFDSAPRQRPAKGESAAAKSSFNDLRETLTEEQVKTECARCLGCGTAVVDRFMCVGCGICTTKCKFDAIHLEKVYDADNQEYFHTLGRIVKNVPKIDVGVVRKHIGKYGG